MKNFNIKSKNTRPMTKGLTGLTSLVGTTGFVGFSVRALVVTHLLFALGCGTDTADAQKVKVNPSAKSQVEANVIYGEDNRLDLYQVNNRQLLQMADATVALVFMTDITIDGDTALISTSPFKDSFRYPLCASERFAEQNAAAFCSGFLVTPNVIVTAGHCVQTQGNPNSDCSTTRFVFGYDIPRAGYRPTQVSTSEVYHCKRILKQKLDSNGADYSVIELDRVVTNHRPLRLRESGQPAVNDELTVIGHPSGLPTKVAGGAKIRSLHNGFIRASLDTYGGNSGSAVFNSQTLEVEGILVRGETDYVPVNDPAKSTCMASKVCAQDECRGEDVTRISEALPYIPME